MINVSKLIKPKSCLDLIRLGRKGDGGYIVSKLDLDKIDFILSFGLDADWSFEKDLSKILYRIGKFDMTQSRLLVKRYNVKSLPCYLAFYNGKLVSCKAMGQKAIKLTKSDDNPRTLLYEPNFADQIKTEKILKNV